MTTQQNVNNQDAKVEEETTSTEESSEIIDGNDEPELTNEERLESELADTKDKLLRCIAEQDNLRKRLQKEKDDAYKYAATGFAKDILAVIDNLERATTAAESNESEKSDLLEGVLLVQQECLTVFKKHGVEKIDAAGTVFNPNMHQAIAEVESDLDAGTVVEVMQSGYMVHGRLLRPSFVSVAKKK